ncbi:CueP family metal-binding protein [Paenibacillus segetis]|uniref:CueP family metal-binding protein n=1 Tax=Paenibacillus segetis TaxID=1325360 RepID=A0ABQ1YDH7_9BACL|nr:CueP family metal-binding protein [Paenibacillus segetis]GGH21221.1 hypothetical protein GCM10008013_19010 [Paenibacillus segetis]
MRRKILVATTGLVVVAIGAFLIVGSSKDKAPNNNNLNAQDIKKLVHDYSIGNIKDQSASITSTELIVSEGNVKKVTYNLPKDEFFLSIGPFKEETHPCAIHSLTGCQGELTEEEFNVTIEDMKGNVVLEQAMKSQSNGFIDLWLPRDTKYRITIEQDGKTAESEISTFEQDNTCITTMQLT